MRINDNAATSPFSVTYNPSLHGQYFSFISIKTRTVESIPLLEIVIPYKGYPEFELFWGTRSITQLNRACSYCTGKFKKVVQLPVQSPIPLLFNQRYAAAKSRTDDNRLKRTERANLIRNTIIKPELDTHLQNLQKIDSYYGEKSLDISKYPSAYPLYRLVQNVVPHKNGSNNDPDDDHNNKKI
jgi:hypothetical protein